MKGVAIFFLFLATIVATSQGFSYLSCRLGVETNNIIAKTVHGSCQNYVKHYMLGDYSQYWKESKAVIDEALLYAKSLKLAHDGKDIWVFDIDDTILSHLPYFVKHGFGIEPINATAFLRCLRETEAPALPESLKLYRELLSIGIKVVFLSGRPEEAKDLIKATETSLKKVGYHSWEKLILKPASYPESTTLESYKANERRKLEDIDGYRIVGNIGDQWSDISGIHRGKRTFKLPNPMYYSP